MKLFSPKRKNLFNEEEKKPETGTELAVVPGEEAKFIYATEETGEIRLSEENVEPAVESVEEVLLETPEILEAEAETGEPENSENEALIFETEPVSAIEPEDEELLAGQVEETPQPLPEADEEPVISEEEEALEGFSLKRPNEDFEVSSESGFIEPAQPEKEFTPEAKTRPRRKRRKELLVRLGDEKEEATQVLQKIDLKDEILEPVRSIDSETIVVNDVDEIRLDIQKRVKQSKRILRRREKSGREIIETRTQELTQNLELPIENDNAVYSNVPDYIFDGGITLYNSLIRQMQQNGTLKVETLMSVLGALAGFSTQMAVREKMVNRMGIEEDQVFSIIKTQNDERYFFSDTIDQLLQKDKHSIWYMSASATMRLSGRVESSIEEIIRYSVRNLGKESFGVPRLTNQTRPSYLPEYFVENMWYGLQEGLERFTNDPLEWPQIFGIAVQRALLTTKGILDSNTSLRIVLECAVPMSMIDLVPVKPEVLSQREMEDVMIERLHNEIEVLRNTLYMAGDEEREELLLELSQKTEQLYVLIENKSKRLKK